MLSPPPAGSRLFLFACVPNPHPAFLSWGCSISNQMAASRVDLSVSTFCSELKVLDGYSAQEGSLQGVTSELKAQE